MGKFSLDGFVRFDSRQASRTIDRISIARTGTIQFSTFFYRKNRLNGKSHVQLYFNSKDRQVAVRFLNSHEEGSCKLLGKKGPYGKYVSARSFLATNQIQVTSTTRYPYRKETYGKDVFYVIDLDGPVPPRKAQGSKQIASPKPL